MSFYDIFTAPGCRLLRLSHGAAFMAGCIAPMGSAAEGRFRHGVASSLRSHRGEL